MKLTVYLSGEIHTSWRDDVETACRQKGLDITFLAPVTDHAASDDCGVRILGDETDKFWHDHKGAKLNAMRTRHTVVILEGINANEEHLKVRSTTCSFAPASCSDC